MATKVVAGPEDVTSKQTEFECDPCYTFEIINRVSPNWNQLYFVVLLYELITFYVP